MCRCRQSTGHASHGCIWYRKSDRLVADNTDRSDFECFQTSSTSISVFQVTRLRAWMVMSELQYNISLKLMIFRFSYQKLSFRACIVSDICVVGWKIDHVVTWATLMKSNQYQNLPPIMHVYSLDEVHLKFMLFVTQPNYQTTMKYCFGHRLRWMVAYHSINLDSTVVMCIL